MDSFNLTEDAPDYKPRNTKEALAKLQQLHAELQGMEPPTEPLPNGLYKITSKAELVPARFSRPRRHHRPEGVLLQFNSRLVPRS